MRTVAGASRISEIHVLKRAIGARFAIFLEIRDGKIAAQHNYDCFDPW